MPDARIRRRSSRSTARKSGTTKARARKRLARNKKRLTLRRLLGPFIFLVVLSGIITGVYYTITSPELMIKRVEVRGTRLLDSDMIKSDVWSIINSDRSAVGKYKNILMLSKKRVTKSVMKHPEVKSVRVGRLLPKTIILKVEERKAFAAVTNGEVYWLVDRDGLLFHQVHAVPSATPAVILPVGKSIRQGKMPAESALYPCLACIADWNALTANQKSKVSKISVDPAGNLCLNIGSEFYVKLGQSVEIADKLKVLSQILEKPEIGERALYIDVSCKEAPVWKPRAGGNEVPLEGRANNSTI